MVVLIYDDIETWGPRLTQIIADRFGSDIIEELSDTKPEYLEDALAWLYLRAERKELQKAVHAGLQDYDVRLFHGTRLLDWEALAIQTQGLLPLRVTDRRRRLCDILQNHPAWSNVKHNIEDALRVYGVCGYAGDREDGCVYASVSRLGLFSSGCLHYLRYGAEIDRHICFHLFGDQSGEDLLTRHTNPYIFSFDVHLDDAIRSFCMMHNFENGLSGFCDMLLEPWSFRQANPDYQLSKQGDCHQAKIRGRILPEVLSIDKIDGSRIF